MAILDHKAIKLPGENGATKEESAETPLYVQQPLSLSKKQAGMVDLHAF